MPALKAGRPEQMNIKQVLEAFIEFREGITRRTIYELRKREIVHMFW